MAEKEIDIQSFIQFDDAMWFLEETVLTQIDNGYNDVKGEIILIDGRWRVSVIVNDSQLEFDI